MTVEKRPDVVNKKLTGANDGLTKHEIIIIVSHEFEIMCDAHAHHTFQNLITDH